ncbi:MAG: ATP-binding protein [Sphaerochaeta sp.]
MPKELIIYGYMDKGYNGHGVLVECSIRNGFPGFDITGLPGASVKEARERVRCAFRSCGIKLPQSRILVNLSPAGNPKNSTLLDLPLACAVLYGQKRKTIPNTHDGKPVKVMIAGELSLDGHVLEAPQAMGAVEAACRLGCQACILPFSIPKTHSSLLLVQALTLEQAFKICCNLMNEKTKTEDSAGEKEEIAEPVFEDIIGMEYEKDIVAMAAGGFHSILLFGPPGVGKTMLCSRINRLLPPMTEKNSTQVARILGCAEIGQGRASPENCSRMRILSHDCTQTQFVSGSGAKSPGEGALSHMGVLLLDEINKYGPKLIEAVRDAYDSGCTRSSRSGEVITYPARFLMAGNMNPCQCAGLGAPNSVCTCTAQRLAGHWTRLGRQMIQRFDIRLPVKPRENILSLIGSPSQADSLYIEKIKNAAARQSFRYRYIDNIDYNGQVHYNTSALRCLEKEIELVNRAKLPNSPDSRSQIGLIALARTIADYEDKADVTEENLAKAVELRRYGLGDYYWRTLN